MKLKNKVAIVTGASSGIGRAIAILFAEHGATVIAIARRKERLDEIADTAAKNNHTIKPYAADLQDNGAMDILVSDFIKTYGKIDILVNNAGIMDNMAPLGDLTDDVWDSVISVNLTSLMKMSRRAIVKMLDSGSGIIINMASIGGLHGGRGGLAYVASKHGVVGLTKNIAYTYANKGIRCNAICPGGVNTEIMKDKQISKEADKLILSDSGFRYAEPEEIAKVALFLASEDSSFINGAAIVADGGWTAF